jgi:hypothetical protein
MNLELAGDCAIVVFHDEHRFIFHDFDIHVTGI